MLGLIAAVSQAENAAVQSAMSTIDSTAAANAERIVNSARDGTAIRDALYGVNYDGVTGSITFDQTTGDANKDMAYIKKAADGAFEFVKTQSVED